MTDATVAVQDRFPGTGIAVLCIDSPDAAAIRASAMQAHLRYIDTVIDEINLAGPLYDSSGRVGHGSIYVLRTTDEQRAREIVESDPLFKAGAFASVTYQRFLPAAGHYVGGKIW
jgi:uncharacterized protein YciI